MIAKTLILVCATFGLVAGSCIEVGAPQECSSSQFVPVPVQAEPSFSAPFVSDSLCSCGSSNIVSSRCAPTVLCDNFCSSETSPSMFSCSSVSSPICENLCSSTASFPLPIASSGKSCSSTSPFSFPAVSSRNSFYDVYSSGSFPGSSSGLRPGNGPETSIAPVIQAPPVTLPAVEGPTITLSSQPIPAPRVLAQRCICTKTVVKPQVYQRLVTVPRIQRYLKRTVTPVVENVSYKSTPISQESGSSGSSSASFAFSSGYGCGSPSSIAFSSEDLSVSGSCNSRSVVCSPVVGPSESSCPRIC